MLQVSLLHNEYDLLQTRYGDPLLKSIYGAGNVNNPKVMFIFMNPTGRNVSSNMNWNGIRAPWLGTKQVWDIFVNLNILSPDIYQRIKSMKANEWEVEFAQNVYSNICINSAYITNLAKCTQIDARPLKNSIFKEYLALMFREIEIVNPQKIITFGNQVSSILLGKNISVSKYESSEKEVLEINNKYDVYPTYYPVGQGRRNMSKALARIKEVIA